MATLDDLLASGLIEPVEPDPSLAAGRLEESERHVRSAEAIAENDPNGGYQLAYDAARKAVTAHMARAGFRIRRRDGGHAITAQYAEIAVSQALGLRLDRMRRRRNRSEYASAHFEHHEVVDAITVARQLVEAVAA